MQLLHHRARELALKDAFTFASLGFGLMAIFYAIEGNPFAPWFIPLSVIADWLDGKVARLMNQSNEFGVQLDSLADACAFGVTPAVLCVLFSHSLSDYLVVGAAIFFAVCVLARLAWFNIQDPQLEKGVYYGIPSTHVSWLSVGFAGYFGFSHEATAVSLMVFGLAAVSGFKFSKATMKKAFGPIGFLFG